MTDGSCLCGAIRYRVEGPFTSMLHCHCSMCRKHHGAAFATFAGAPLTGFRWLAGEHTLASYESSPGGRRWFCGTCGSIAPLLLPQMGLALCPAGNLDADPGIRPQAHMFVGSKAPWYTITDDLPQYAQYPPEFSAAGIPRATVEPRPGAYPGSCLCGEVAYEATGAPMFMWSCHCGRCRHGRSAAHGTNIFFRLEQFRFLRGESQAVAYKVPEARFFAVSFCKRCGGSAPFISRERSIVVVPAGTLDTDPGMQPQAHIFTGSRACWFDITGDTPQFAESPPRP